MKRRSRNIAASLLILLAGVSLFGIVSAHDWGGRVEVMLMVFGDRVWVTVDAGQPRVFLLTVVPGVLSWAAFSLFVRRPGE